MGEMDLIAEDQTRLVERSKNGDQDAMGELVRQNYQRSLRVARSILHNQQESEDAVQAAYGSAFHHLDTFRQTARFSSWITRIVMNESIMALRRLRVDRQVSLEQLTESRELSRYLASDIPTPEDFARSCEFRTRLAHALDGVPVKLRQSYVLFALFGLRMSEVADLLGLTAATVKSRIFRARCELRSRMRESSPVTSP
jgi:RNA polymerase sigma-70 factor, ECF subfamily